MAINVKHSKVSTIPDGDDTSLIRPSDWNADHVLVGTIPVENGGTGASTLTGYVKGNGTSAMTAASTIPSTDITGLGTMASQNANNVTITGGSISGTTVSGYIPTTDEGVANGVATLDSAGKVPISQIPDAVIGALNYQGTWNATTNTPTLTSSVGTKGYYYVVSVAGTTNLNGVTDWQVGDWAVYNGTAWQKVDNTDGVTSVNGFTGAVTLTTTNIAEGTNEYFTTARARSSLSAGTGISYDSSTGVITNSSPSLGGDVVGPSSATDNAIARFDTTTGKLIQNSVVTIDDAGNIIGNDSLQFSGTPPVTQPIGTLWYDGTTETLNFQQNNITQQIGEELFVYGKASSAITDSPLQIVYKTGVVGASGVITFAPTVSGITNDDVIIGVATENIALNATGRITCFGVVHNITTNGAAYGETWADGDTIWYNPVTGNPTKTKPTAPNVKCQIGTVINAGSGGSGSFQVEIIHGTSLGGTDSNVNIVSPTAAQILTYDTTDAYWKNTSLASGTGISTSTNANGTLTVNNTGVTSAVAGTGISVSGATGAVTVTNTAPDQTVAIASGTGISVTGTYPNFTVTNTSPSSGGTVTSVAALTLGTTGTDLSSTVANSTTTPVITLNVPTASATNRGALSSTDWSTFNSKAPGVTFTTSYVPFGQGTTTLNQSSSFTYASSTLTAPVVSASNGLVVNSNTVSASYSIPSGSSASSVGPMTVASGQTVTIPSGSRWLVL